MGGFSIYLLLLMAIVLAAPRRPSLYLVLAMTGVTAFSVLHDLAERPAQHIEQVSTNDISIDLANHATATATSRTTQ